MFSLKKCSCFTFYVNSVAGTNKYRNKINIIWKFDVANFREQKMKLMIFKYSNFREKSQYLFECPIIT